MHGNETGLYVRVYSNMYVYTYLFERACVSVTLVTLSVCVGVSSTIPCSSERSQHS